MDEVLLLLKFTNIISRQNQHSDHNPTCTHTSIKNTMEPNKNYIPNLSEDIKDNNIKDTCLHYQMY